MPKNKDKDNLRLFQITDTASHGNKAVPDLFFSEKEKAKIKRRELNEVEPGKSEQLRYVVSPGPDHRHYAG